MKRFSFDEILSGYNCPDLNSEKFSSLFKRQVEKLVENDQGEQYVFHEILCLEHNLIKSKTKPPERFKKKPLKGLWKKHYLNPTFIPKNIENNLGRITKNSRHKEPSENIMRSYGIYTLSFMEKISEKISKDIVWGTYNEKQEKSRWTGEWIIFAIINNKNYYLCIANHADGDENTLRKIIENCEEEVDNFLTKDGYAGDS